MCVGVGGGGGEKREFPSNVPLPPCCSKDIDVSAFPFSISLLCGSKVCPPRSVCFGMMFNNIIMLFIYLVYLYLCMWPSTIPSFQVYIGTSVALPFIQWDSCRKPSALWIHVLVFMYACTFALQCIFSTTILIRLPKTRIWSYIVTCLSQGYE